MLAKKMSLQIHQHEVFDCGLGAGGCAPGLAMRKGIQRKIDASSQLFYPGKNSIATLCPLSGKTQFLLRAYEVLRLPGF